MTMIADVLNPILWRELAGIGAVDAAVRRQTEPGYTFLLNETKLAKQANVSQLLSMLRLARQEPALSTGAAGIALKAHASITQAMDTTAALRALRLVGRELIGHYVSALETVDDEVIRRGLRKALSRAIIDDTIASAHIAGRTGKPSDARDLPRALSAYFARNDARVCMRCLLDRSGRAAPIERGEPRPHQYICGACHFEVFNDFPEDLRVQAPHWPDTLREDRVVHRALSRPSRLEAIQEVLHPLSGLNAERPVPASARAEMPPIAVPLAGPDQNARAGTLTLGDAAPRGAESEYVEILFAPDRLRRYW